MKINEKNFIGKLKIKDEKALEYVVDNYGPLVKSIVKKHVINEYMQEECMDDIFLAIWYKIDCFDSSRSSFKNWIAGISKFKSIDYQRKHYREKREECHENIEISGFVHLEDEILQNEIDENVEKLLACLKENEKKLFIDYYVQEKQVNEIAKNLNIKSSAVYNKLSRGRNKVRLALKGN